MDDPEISRAIAAERLAAIRERLADAPQFALVKTLDGNLLFRTTYPEDTPREARLPLVLWCRLTEREAWCDLIAHAPTDLADLLAAVDALTAERDALRAELASWQDEGRTLLRETTAERDTARHETEQLHEKIRQWFNYGASWPDMRAEWVDSRRRCAWIEGEPDAN